MWKSGVSDAIYVHQRVRKPEHEENQKDTFKMSETSFNIVGNKEILIPNNKNNNSERIVQ